MQYLDDMLSKWGFDEGETMPPGVEAYREAYVTTLNTLLEAKHSTIRVIAWDRPGLHNWCMIAHVSAATGELLLTHDRDGGYHEALALAEEIDADQCVCVTAEVDTGLLSEVIQLGLTGTWPEQA